jgi:hypothetical protein
LKTRQISAYGLIAVLITLTFTALSLTGCDTGGGGKPEPAHTHEWGAWQETTAPTITEDGIETRTCITCGATETKPIAKLLDPFEGTWVGTGSSMAYKVVAVNGSFTQYNDNVMIYKGTYTVSDNTVTMTWTHEYKNNEWVTFSAVMTGTISGNTLTADSVIFTKQ